MLLGDYFARLAEHRIPELLLRFAAAIAFRLASWIVAGALLALTFAVLYYWAPDCEDEALALAHAGRGRRNCRMAAGIVWLARIPPFLQQLHRDVRIAGSGNHPADVVLHHRVDAAAGG